MLIKGQVLADLENQLVISIDLTDTTNNAATTTATNADIVTIIATSTKDAVTTPSNNSVTDASEGGGLLFNETSKSKYAWLKFIIHFHAFLPTP